MMQNFILNNGNVLLQTDPMGHETAYSYDGMGRLVSVLTEEGREQTFTYDTLGNMISKTDFGGKTTQYEYDYRGNSGTDHEISHNDGKGNSEQTTN